MENICQKFVEKFNFAYSLGDFALSAKYCLVYSKKWGPGGLDWNSSSDQEASFSPWRPGDAYSVENVRGNQIRSVSFLFMRLPNTI